MECKQRNKHKAQNAASVSSTSSSQLSMAEIKNIIDQLQMQQHRSSTLQSYLAVWKIFNAFFVRLRYQAKDLGGSFDIVCWLPHPK